MEGEGLFEGMVLFRGVWFFRKGLKKSWMDFLGFFGSSEEDIGSVYRGISDFRYSIFLREVAASQLQTNGGL